MKQTTQMKEATQNETASAGTETVSNSKTTMKAHHVSESDHTINPTTSLGNPIAPIPTIEVVPPITTSIAELMTENDAARIYLETLCSHVGMGKSNFDDNDNFELVSKYLAKMPDESGNQVTLSDEQQDRLALIFAPVADVKRRELARLLDEAGFVQAPTLLRFLNLQLDGASFEKHLAKKVNPVTKKPFITIVKRKRSGDMFDDLLKQGPLAGKPDAAADESNAESDKAKKD